MHRLIGPQGKVISTKAKFDRIAQGGPTNHFHIGTVAESHLQKPTANLRIPTNGEDRPLAADSELVQSARLGRLAVVTSRKFATLLHGQLLTRP
jgi:hypothetical protein